ncbi:MAG: type 2 isopentenyl-diphosphate Delta-isomerase [Candidatus Bathyarchaeia archaeon]
MVSETIERKKSHIKTALSRDVQAHVSTGFDDVSLVHNALPELDRDEIDLSCELLGHKLGAPVIIESMTGGTPIAAKINATLGRMAEELQIPMGVGSQRAAIDDPKLAYTFKVARESAPSALLLANLGCPQIIKEDGMERAVAAVEMIKADALLIHLNALQESVQFEGQTRFRGALGRIRELSTKLSVPVLVKETGAGVSRETAVSVERAGVKGIDVAGLGGTSWAAVEYHRAREKRRARQAHLGLAFWDWGIPTAASVVEVARSTKVKIIASGGVRNGLHIAKAIALGAHYGGLAMPLLQSVSKGHKETKENLLSVIDELRTAMFLTGSMNLEQLHKCSVTITGKTREWLIARGLLS